MKQHLYLVDEILTQSQHLNKLRKCPKTVIPAPNSGFVTSAWFANISLWSRDDCFDFVRYYIENELIHRKGWNNNLSLVTKEGRKGYITWSLIYWKFKHFEKGTIIIIPFTLQLDNRGILRAATKFLTIKERAVFWSRTKNAIAVGEYRDTLIEFLYWRLLCGFGWKSKSLYKRRIRRYRLVALLNSPNLVLNSDFDVHHLNGIKHLLNGNKTLAATDDRRFNLEIQHKLQHERLHKNLGDNRFENYRELND